MNAHNSALESLDFTALVLPQDAQMVVTDPMKQAASGLRETQARPAAAASALVTIQSLLQQYQEQTRNWVLETAPEKQLRSQGLRRITYALFGLAIILSSFLNGQFIVHRASLPQLVICNFGITIIYLLAGVCLLHDITFRKRDAGSQSLDVNRRMSIAVSQIDELLGVANELGQRNEDIASKNFALNQQSIECERQRVQAAQAFEEAQKCLQASHIEKIELETQLRHLTKEIDAAKDQLDSVASQQAARAHEGETRVKEIETELQSLTVQLEGTNALREESRLQLTAIQNNLKLLQEEQSELQCCIASLHDSVQSRQNQLSEIDLSLSMANEEFERIQLQSFDVSESLHIKTKDLENVMAEVAKASEQLSTLSTEADQHYECFKAASETLESVRAENAELDTGIVAKRSMLQEMENQLEQLRLDFAETNVELVRIRQESAAANGYLSEHQQAVSESRQAIQRFSDLEPQIADLDCKLAMRNAELAATEQAVLELDHEREEMLKRLEYSAALEAVSQTRISSLSSDCDRFRSVRDELEAVVESLQQQADSAEQDASRLIAHKAEAAGSLEGLLESVEKLHSQELSLRQACESAEEKLLEWTNTADQLISRVETLTEQVDLLDSQKLEAVVAIEGLLQQIDEAKIERDQLNAKNLIQASAVEGAEARLSSIQQQMQSKEIELNDLINQLVSTEMQFASVSERCLVEQAELQRLVECSRRAEADADTLRAEKELLDERRLELVREIDGFEAKRADAMHAANAESDQLLILESKLHDASKELQTFAIQREHFQQESVQHAQLQANIAAAQCRLDDLIAQGQLTERASKDARDELNQIQRSIREVRLDMDALVSKEDRLNEELEALRTDRDKLESECQRIEVQRKASEQVVAERTASLDKINDECIKAESRREKLFKTLDSISKEVDEAQSVCNQWDVYGNKLKSENELLAGELAQLRGSLQSIEKERSALEQSKIALEASLNKLRKEAVTVAAEVEGKETKLMDLREEQSRLLHLVGTSQSEFEDIQSRIQTSNFELIRLRSELENAKNDVFEHRHRCAELVNQSGELAERTKSQTSLYEAARLKVDEAERDLELRYAKMSEVERLLSERTSLAKDLLRQVDQSKEALELLECQLHATTDSQMQQASELAATKSEIQSQKLIMDGHCEQISHAVVHIQSLLVEKDRIQLTVGELNEESERTKVALRERELELHAMESKRDAMADEIRKRQLLVEQLEGQLSSVQAAVQDEESQFQTRKSQQQIALDALKKEMDAISVEHEDARLQRTAMEQSISDRQADLEKLRESITELQAERAHVEAEGVERRESIAKEFSRLQDQHTAMQEQVQNAEAALASKAEALLRLDVAIRDLDEHEQELRLAVERLVKEQTVYDARVLELRCEEENRVTNVSKLEEQIANLQVAESVLTVRIETVQQEIADMLAKRALQDNSTQRKVRIVKLGVRRVTNEQPGNVVPTETVRAQVSPAGAIPADSIPVDSVLTEGTELNAAIVSTTSEGIAEEDLLGEVVQSVDEVAKIVASEMGGEIAEGKSVSTLVETEIVDDAWSFVLSSSK